MPILPPIHRWDDVARPRASVHVAHGMSEHGRRYERFAAALNKAGFNVWAHDHRGHGINSSSGHPGHFADGGNLPKGSASSSSREGGVKERLGSASIWEW